MKTTSLIAFAVQIVDRHGDAAPEIGTFRFSGAHMSICALVHLRDGATAKLCDCSACNRDDVFIRFHGGAHGVGFLIGSYARV